MEQEAAKLVDGEKAPFLSAVLKEWSPYLQVYEHLTLPADPASKISVAI